MDFDSEEFAPFDSVPPRLMQLITALRGAGHEGRTASYLKRSANGYGQYTVPESFQRTLDRDIRDLAAVGVFVEKVNFPDGVRYRLKGNSAGHNIRFTAEEWALIQVATSMLLQPDLRAQVANMSMKLAPAAVGSDQFHAIRNASYLIPDSILLSADEHANLFDAVGKHPVQFLYQPNSATDWTERQMEPWGWEVKDGRTYLIGWDTDRDAVRAFRAPHIDDLQVRTDLTVTQPVPSSHELAALVTESLRRNTVDHEDAELSVPLRLVSAFAKWLSDDNLPTHADIVADGERLVPLKVSGANPDELLRTICEFQPDVTVQSPESLKDQVRKRFTGILADLDEETPIGGGEVVTGQMVRSYLANVMEDSAPQSAEVAPNEVLQLWALIEILENEATEEPIAFTELTRRLGVTRSELTKLLEMMDQVGSAEGTGIGVKAGDLLLDAHTYSYIESAEGVRLTQSLHGFWRPLAAGEGTWETSRQGFRELSHLRPDEIGLTLIALKHLRSAPALYGDVQSLGSAISKLESLVGIEPSDTAVAAPAASNPIHHAIDQALQQNKALRFTYHGETRNTVTERLVDPVRAILKDGRPFLVAIDRKVHDQTQDVAQSRRTFFLDRMSDIEVSSARRRRYEDIDVDANDPGNIRDVEQWAELLVVKDLWWVADYTDMELVFDDSERAWGYLPLFDIAWAARFIQAYGPGIQVVGPHELREVLRNQVAKTLSQLECDPADTAPSSGDN